MSNHLPLLKHLQQQTGQKLDAAQPRPVGGGDINQAFHLQAPGVDWFLKLNRAALEDMFQAEAAGLRELAAEQCLNTPAVVTAGSFQQHAYLVLDFIPLRGLDSAGHAALGHGLAALHRRQKDYFGWRRDNTIGATPQHNPRQTDWVIFWREQRLGKQLQFAAANGYGGKLQTQGEKLCERVDDFFHAHQPHPSLLHGDLWGGNAAMDAAGQPVIFDPACYYGDRETDIAMTELFGGFGREFYAAYQAEYPLERGYKTRKDLYNLYHILNHLNLFGGAYLSQAQHMISRLLAELG